VIGDDGTANKTKPPTPVAQFALPEAHKFKVSLTNKQKKKKT
jgi:hypothetical protein